MNLIFEYYALSRLDVSVHDIKLYMETLREFYVMFPIKGKWQQNVLSSHLKETPKQYIEVYYRIFISALFGEIF